MWDVTYGINRHFSPMGGGVMEEAEFWVTSYTLQYQSRCWEVIPPYFSHFTLALPSKIRLNCICSIRFRWYKKNKTLDLQDWVGGNIFNFKKAHFAKKRDKFEGMNIADIPYKWTPRTLAIPTFPPPIRCKFLWKVCKVLDGLPWNLVQIFLMHIRYTHVCAP